MSGWENMLLLQRMDLGGARMNCERWRSRKPEELREVFNYHS